MRVAVRIANTADLAVEAVQRYVNVHREANAAIRQNPDAEYAIRNIEATVAMVLPTIIGRYGTGQ
jgi:hypothetical protein